MMTTDEDELMATTTEEEVPLTAVWNAGGHRAPCCWVSPRIDRWFESSGPM